jgi:N-acetylglutamate synthase-like GNAT family acetyltransferase
MQIDFLANHPLLVAQIADWCNQAWPWYYSDGNLEHALAYHRSTAQLAQVPCALVALDGSDLAGTIAIIYDDMETRSTLNPWLGCLYVSPSKRGHGVASRLIDAGVNLARSLELPMLYAWTEALRDPLLKKGWIPIETTEYRGKQAHILSVICAGQR